MALFERTNTSFSSHMSRIGHGAKEHFCALHIVFCSSQLAIFFVDILMAALSLRTWLAFAINLGTSLIATAATAQLA